MRLPPGRDVDGGVRIGALQHRLVLVGDPEVPRDQLVRRAIGLAIVAIQQLRELDGAVIHRGGAVDDDMPDAARVFHVHAARERQVPVVLHLARGVRRGYAGDLVRLGRVQNVHDGGGVEAVIRLHQLVHLRLGLRRVAERRLVHEGEMGVVERVLHHTQRRGLPGLVELEDTPERRVAVFRDVEQVFQRLFQGDPGVAVARGAPERLHAQRRQRLVGLVLRDADQCSGAVIGPAVVAADDAAGFAPALGELGGAVAAAVPQRTRRSRLVEEQHDVDAHEAERLWPGLEFMHWHDGVQNLRNRFCWVVSMAVSRSRAAPGPVWLHHRGH